MELITMKVVFIGCVESSAIFLRTLLQENANIVGIITKKESKFNADFMDLSDIGKKNNIPCLYVENINDKESFQFLRKLNPDIGFCLGWSQLLKSDLLNMFPKGVIGFHPTKLPWNRGRHPLIWTLVLGLDETASSFFVLDEMADTGKVISQERVLVSYEDNARTLYNKIMDVAKVQLKKVWHDICTNNVKVVDFEGQKGNTWRKRGKVDGKIDWRMSGRNIYNLVRALSEPYVGAHFEYNGYEYKVWEAREVSDEQYKNIEPGKIVDICERRSFIVKTGKGMIEVLRFDECFDPQIGMYL